MYSSTVTSKGQIVIPAPLRRKLGFREGMKVIIAESDDGISVRPANQAYFEQFAGLLSGEKKATEALLAERKKERDHENRRS